MRYLLPLMLTLTTIFTLSCTSEPETPNFEEYVQPLEDRIQELEWKLAALQDYTSTHNQRIEDLYVLTKINSYDFYVNQGVIAQNMKIIAALSEAVAYAGQNPDAVQNARALYTQGVELQDKADAKMTEIDAEIQKLTQ